MLRPILLVLLFISNLYATNSMNEIPMYGGKNAPKVKEDKDLSIKYAKLGWKYFYKGDLKTAMKRFNLAWAHDKKNQQVFWGFGLISGRMSLNNAPLTNIKESIKYLEIAKMLGENNERVLTDLAYSQMGLAAFYKKKRDSNNVDLFKKAKVNLFKAESLNNSYPPIYSNLSILEFHLGNYKKAEEYLSKAKKLGFRPNPNYERELNRKLKK